MRFAGHFIASLLLAGFFSVAVPAQDVAASANPYVTVVARNVFGLVPIPTVDPASLVPPAELPPKITPNGIMTLFGKLQVLFKVATKPPAGQPAVDESYTMSEGERQDEIEVVKIDGKAGVVTFNNHGTVQELALVAATASSGAAPAPGGAPANPGFPLPRGGSPTASGRFGRPPANADPNTAARSGANNSGANNSGGFNFGGSSSGTPTSNRIYNPAAEGTETLSPEAQVIMMEAQRAQWKEQGNPAAMIIPPTPLTPPTAPGE